MGKICSRLSSLRLADSFLWGFVSSQLLTNFLLEAAHSSRSSLTHAFFIECHSTAVCFFRASRRDFFCSIFLGERLYNNHRNDMSTFALFCWIKQVTGGKAKQTQKDSHRSCPNSWERNCRMAQLIGASQVVQW